MTNNREKKMPAPISEGRGEQAQIDQLVDGSLSTAELASLIDSLDRSADGWKNCAMTFLEQQFLRKEMDALVGASNDSDRLSAARSSYREPSHCDQSYREQLERGETQAEFGQPQLSEPRRPWWQLNRSVGLALATAASLVVAIGIGVYVDGLLYPAGYGTGLGSAADTDGQLDDYSGSQIPGGALAASQTGELPLKVRDHLSGQSRTVSVPISGQSARDELFGGLEVGSQVQAYNDIPYRVERKVIPVQAGAKLYSLPIEKHQVVNYGKHYQ